MANFLFVLVGVRPSPGAGGEGTDGVQWADSTRDLSVKTTTGDCPNDYLPYLVENEVPIGV